MIYIPNITVWVSVQAGSYKARQQLSGNLTEKNQGYLIYPRGRNKIKIMVCKVTLGNSSKELPFDTLSK